MIVDRYAVRAVLLTPQEEILLMRIHGPGSGKRWWITPGGGLEPGESVEQGFRRELREELGLLDFEIGPRVWRRHHTFDWGEKRISQREEYRIVRVQRFEPRISDPIEAEAIDCFRWWSAAALRNCEEELTPLSLADIVANFLANGPPAEPLAVEYLVD